MVGRVLVKDLSSLACSALIDELEKRGHYVPYLKSADRIHSIYIYPSGDVSKMTNISFESDDWFENHSLPELQVSDILDEKPLASIYDS